MKLHIISVSILVVIRKGTALSHAPQSTGFEPMSRLSTYSARLNYFLLTASARICIVSSADTALSLVSYFLLFR